jgi:Raf kinase inhibitor-like YbhB/YbcL family protein
MTSSHATHPPAQSGPDPYAYLPKVPSFQLTSSSVTNGQPLPLEQLSKMFGVPGGQDLSPQLSWSGFPAETESFVVSMYDPQAPTGSGFWHWVVADIPAGTTSLPAGAGAPDAAHLPSGAFQLAGDAGAHQYVGGAPPAGSGVHEYFLTVTALNVAKTGLDENASAAYLGFTIAGHTLARATLIWPTPASAA